MVGAIFSQLCCAIALAACGGGVPTAPQPNRAGGSPAMYVASAQVSVSASGGPVSLPVPTPGGLPIDGDNISANFPPIPAATEITATDYDGLAVAAPSTSAWSGCPWPLEQIVLVFPSDFSITATPSITISSARVSPSTAYYYNELFDADSNPSATIASEKVTASSAWPSQTVVAPSMPGPWMVTKGHRYIFEIVPSTAAGTPCSGVFN